MLSSKVFNSFLSPQSFLSRSAQLFRDKEAVVYGSQRLTYAQLAARVNQLASALRSWGLSKGERVAFLAPNIPPMLTVLKQFC
ncbi:MAG: AMP-binding protein [Xenococcaceae cyanobacterium MO_188.B29]|nr:AMP-binding protein [Xenococcaceae cyanobacterium MO_188.B29]